MNVIRFIEDKNNQIFCNEEKCFKKFFLFLRMMNCDHIIITDNVKKERKKYLKSFT